MPWIVYDNDTRIIVPGGILATSAAATARAAEDGDWSAYASEVTGNDWNANAEPGWCINTSGKVVRELVLTELEERKQFTRTIHHQLNAWAAALNMEGVTHPVKDVNRGHDFLAHGHGAIYVVVTSSNWTHAQKKKFCEEMVKGSSDVTTPHEFLRAAHTLADDDLVPTYACAWVNPNTGARVQMTEIVQMSLGDAAPTEAGLAAAGWFNGLLVDMTTVALSDGAWIDDIT